MNLRKSERGDNKCLKVRRQGGWKGGSMGGLTREETERFIMIRYISREMHE